MTNTDTVEIVRVLRGLPPEKVGEVGDFAIFLRERYGETTIIDENDEWSEEDYVDATFASTVYGYSEPGEEE